MSKYRNVKVKSDDGVFDSKKEYARWGTLKLLEKAKIISNLKRQVPFQIEVCGVKVCKYEADFVYTDERNQVVVEDAKGMKTPVYNLKKKLMKAVHNISIKEV